MQKPTRCISCLGFFAADAFGLKDCMFVEPTSPDNSEPVYLRGWICEECQIVNWATEVKDEHPESR